MADPRRARRRRQTPGDERGAAARARRPPAAEPHDLREEWARRITEAQLLTAMTQEEIFSEATSVYDNYVEVLETGSVEALQDYARNLSERIIPRGVETDEVLGIVLLLRDVLARSLFEKYQDDFSSQPRPRRLRAGRQPHRQHGGGQLRAGARAHHPPAAGGDPRALHAGAAGARAAADPADHRRARLPARAPAHRAAAARHPRQPRQGGRDRHHRRADDRLDGGQPPGADRRGVAAHGRERDHHRPVVGDRADARHDRRRPVQGQRGRRPAGRHRGGRAAARLRGPLRGAEAPRSRSARPASRGRPDPQAGPVPDRLDPGGAHGHGRAPPAGRRHAPGRAASARAGSSSTSPRST